MKLFINEKELAEMVGVSLSSLRMNRVGNKGFPYYKFGKSVRYKLSEIEESIEKNKVEHKEG